MSFANIDATGLRRAFREQIPKEDFSKIVAKLLSLYAKDTDNTRFLATFYALDYSSYDGVFYELIYATSNISTIVAIARALLETNRDALPNLFTDKLHPYCERLLDHLSDTPEFDKFLPFWIETACTYRHALNPTSQARLARFLSPLLKGDSDNLLINTHTSIVAILNDESLLKEIISTVSKPIFKALLRDLRERGSSLVLTALQYCSDSQMTCIDKMGRISYTLFNVYSKDKMFSFLINLSKPKRERLYSAHLLANGSSVKSVVEELVKLKKWGKYDKEQLALIPPPLLVACFISLQTILKLCAYMSQEQIRFIAYYGRKSSAIAVYDQLNKLNLPYQMRHFRESLPCKPELHAKQLTQFELRSRVEAIRA